MFKGRSPVGTIHCRFANSPAFIGSLVNENCCIVGGTEGGGSMYGRVMTGVSCTSRVPTCFDVDGSAALLFFFLFFFFLFCWTNERRKENEGSRSINPSMYAYVDSGTRYSVQHSIRKREDALNFSYGRCA